MPGAVDVIGLDILPLLREHGMPPGFVNQAAFNELVRRLEASPTPADRVRLNDELVAMQNGEVPGSTPEEISLAANMSLAWGMSIGAYLAELGQLKMPPRPEEN